MTTGKCRTSGAAAASAILLRGASNMAGFFRGAVIGTCPTCGVALIGEATRIGCRRCIQAMAAVDRAWNTAMERVRLSGWRDFAELGPGGDVTSPAPRLEIGWQALASAISLVAAVSLDASRRSGTFSHWEDRHPLSLRVFTVFLSCAESGRPPRRVVWRMRASSAREAFELARSEVSAEGGYAPGDVTCMGVAAGDVEIVEWEHESGAGVSW